jgi:WD40 repeat protein
LASASEDKTVRLWDAATGASPLTLEGHSSWIRAVVFSPDSKLVASASDDGMVRLWDAATRVSQQTLEGHYGSVKAVHSDAEHFSYKNVSCARNPLPPLF